MNIWNLILKGNRTGYRFLRQKIIETYILDFYCGKLKLAIEIDGESYNYSVDYDEKRNKTLESFGIKTNKNNKIFKLRYSKKSGMSISRFTRANKINRKRNINPPPFGAPSFSPAICGTGAGGQVLVLLSL